MISLGSVAAAGGMGGTLSYKTLQSKYQDFAYPQASIELNGKPFKGDDGQMIIGNINIELTCGFEASIARFRIYDVFDPETGKFRFEDVKTQVVLGASLKIQLGYLDTMETVFVGFVASVNFTYDPIDLPYIEVTGMDVKGIMMANNYAMQLTAKSYGEAVREILQRTAYEKLKTAGGITEIAVTDTPDKQQQQGGKTSAETIEMVSESDYEFVVKAAKKFNFEFFVDCGKVYFRKAKSNTTPLIELGVGAGVSKFDVGYSLTGIVESIEARAMDASTGKVIVSKGTFSNDISTSNKAKKLVKKSKKVYIDPTITSQAQADERVASLMETMSYRLGSMECECVGIPELVPGRFVELSGLGSPVENQFYVTTVIHDFQEETGYKTRIIGKAAMVKGGM